MAEGRRADIVAAARDILETSGPDALTMRAIATRLGIKAPSLYKHYPDKEALEADLMAEALGETAGIFATAAASTADPIPALADAYRRWALDHPHLYRLLNDRPLPRERLPEGLEARAARPLVDAAGGDRARARAFWGLAHGLVSLELADRFPADADIDAAWAIGTSALARGRRVTRQPAAPTDPKDLAEGAERP